MRFRLSLDVGGRRIRHAAYHAPPFGRKTRAEQNELVVALYELRDPYAGVDWFEGLVHQCEWDYDERGRRRHRADRAAGEVLWAGGLRDAAAALRAPWQATAGHHPGDEYGTHGVRRRIDGIRVTAPVLPALRAHWVTDTELTRQASDHLPVTVEYLPAAIAPGQPARQR